MARLSLHLSKSQIDGNLMPWLKLLYCSLHTLVLASAVLVVDVGALLSPSGFGGVPAG